MFKISFPRFSGHLKRFSQIKPVQNLQKPFSTLPNFLSGENSVYADQMYEQWKTDPSSVHPSWNIYFSNAESGNFAFTDPTALISNSSQSQASPFPTAAPLVRSTSISSNKNVNLVHLVRAYQNQGHLRANIDPLNLMEEIPAPTLDPSSYGFTDLNEEVDLSGFDGISGYLGSSGSMTLGKLLDSLHQTYCSNIGLEYMHITSRKRSNFIRERFEIEPKVKDLFSREEKLQVLDRLTYAVQMEAFLAKKWNTAKRFGLEGCESFVVGFKSLIDESTKLGVQNVFIGMAHRGRLNVLANVIRKDLAVIFREFEGTAFDVEDMKEQLEKSYAFSGDVKYHLGASFKRSYDDGRTVNLFLAANPSHLEAVNPVVEGRTRARQFYERDHTGLKSMPVLVHGDAAFCGQGVVYETMHMGELENYKTGGTIHIVINNQIGFTTDPRHSRSTRYCTDIGKAFNCPIFHVNADDPLAVAYVCKVAAEYRQTFNSDVIVDVIGYRQLGHNEMDQPFFTQPEMYKVIKNHPNVLKVFQEDMKKEGITVEDIEKIEKDAQAAFDQKYALSKEEGKVEPEEWIESPKWQKLKSFGETASPQSTSVEKDVLVELGLKANTVPEGFSPHPTLKKMLNLRLDRIQNKQDEIDWGLGEQLAFASLLNENIHVRVSGQDSQRGTFAHRHAVLHDQKSFDTFTGLNNLFSHNEISEGKKQSFIASNSSLSEYGVMGFELGYSLEDPDALVIWEAQFGDFVNGAQIIIDQFLSCGEQKWDRQNGLVLLLPHGYDGQGPDHSSCRLERFLQNSDEDPDVVSENERPIQDCNWQVVNPTTPSQIFHLLRRQIKRKFRKPLVVASPKAILRTSLSPLSEFYEEGARFKWLIPEVEEEISSNPDSVRKLIFCSGKVYFELEKKRKEKGLKDVAIARIEQIIPFPFEEVAKEVAKYKNADLVFCQEEPKNMGTWYYTDDRIYTSLRHYLGQERRATYVGRGTMSSPAVGYAAVHALEQDAILEEALS
eukprot:maker-scaffold_10-snap-gene-7.1-mRNA-1 protein AED:0.02 eAED:0.03 QI:0/0/0/1/0.5/0.66/3/0/1003